MTNKLIYPEGQRFDSFLVKISGEINLVIKAKLTGATNCLAFAAACAHHPIKSSDMQSDLHKDTLLRTATFGDL